MRYMRAADVLPPDLLEQIQAYIDGEYLYIPRRETERKPWGAANGRKAETLARNLEIYRRYREGTSVDQLAEETALAIGDVLAALTELEIYGLAEPHPGRLYSLA